jgi:hypothetical protein
MSSRTSPGEELLWREAIFAELAAHPDWPDLLASELNDRRVYRGQAGIWVDVSTTRSLCDPGVAVSVLHTGRHYADDLNEDDIIYHYPRTRRATSSDANEVQAVKNAQTLGLPVFVLTQHGPRRRIRKGWVISHDDAARVFLIEFSDVAPPPLAVEVDHAPFERTIRRDLTTAQIQRRNRSPKFKYQAIQRYDGRCVVTGIDVIEMLDAAHVIPVEAGGSDDPRNSLLLNAAAHRAFDARLWAINPTTLKIETRQAGPQTHRMRLTNLDLSGATRLPHREALEWRFERFLETAGRT